MRVGKSLTGDLASNEDAQGDSKAKGQVNGKETTMGAPAEHDLGHRATAKHLCQETKQGKEGEAQLRPSNSHSGGKDEADNLCLSPLGAQKARPGIQPKSLLLQLHPGKKQICPPTPNVPTLT